MIEAAFDGEIVILRGAVWSRLAARAEALVRVAFPGEPLTAHQRLSAPDYLQAATALRAAIKADAAIRSAWREGLSAAGLNPETVFRDRMILRAQPPRGLHESRETMQLPPHRDNWGSGVPQQLNWWMPVLPVSRDRTLWLYPSLFRRKVANDSVGWDFDAVLRAVREGRAGLTTPHASAPVDPALAHPLLIDPGEMAVFSGAQLHQSAPNAGPLARFNLETRTVCRAHLQQGLGAPNIDGAPQGPHYRWFRHTDTNRRMDRALQDGGGGA